MATGTAGDTGQRYHTNQEHYLIKRVSYADWSGTNNDSKVVGVLPPRAIVTGGSAWIVTGFNDTTGDDLDVGVPGTDNLFGSALDANTGDTLRALAALADANRWSTSARTVTVNFTTAPTGDGSTGEAIIYLTYVIAPSVS